MFSSVPETLSSVEMYPTLKGKCEILEERLTHLCVKLNNKKENFNDLNDNIVTYESSKKSLPILRIELDKLNKNNQELTNNKSYFENDIKNIISVIACRAKLIGKEPKLSNIRTREIQEKIDKINEQIGINEQNMYELHDKINVLYKFDVNKINNEQKLIKEEIKELGIQQFMLEEAIEYINHVILQEKMRSQYDKYACDNDIVFDCDDDFDIFRKCNIHCHNILLDGHETYTKCMKQGRRCSEDVVLTINKYGDIYGKCECGYGRWIKEDIPENLFEFNITKTHVYGHMDWSDY